MSNCCCSAKEDPRDTKLKDVMKKHKGAEGALIQVLHEAQEIYGYLPFEVQKMISVGMDVPLAEIYGVVTFYSHFSLKPKGKFRISVCMGTACYVKGSGLILDKLKEKLKLEVGECTEDGNFSLDACRCLGACGLAPVLTINDEVYGRLVPEDVDVILEKYENTSIRRCV